MTNKSTINIATWVLKAIPGDCESSRAHVVIESSTYDRVWKEIDKDENMVIVGWYHSHPNLGIFLSGTDTQNMKAFHYKPYQIAIVIDPIQNFRGVFAWKNNTLKRLGEDSRIFSGDYKRYFRIKYADKFQWESSNMDIILKKVCISREAVDTMEKHIRKYSPNEIGGLLIGKPSVIEYE